MSFEERASQYLVALGLVLRAERDRLGLSQEELAERADLDRTFVSALERGRQNLSAKTMLRIGDALGTTPAKLLAIAEGEMGAGNPDSRR